MVHNGLIMKEGKVIKNGVYGEPKTPKPNIAIVGQTLSIKYPERNGEFTVQDLVKYRVFLRFLEADAMLKERKEKGL